MTDTWQQYPRGTWLFYDDPRDLYSLSVDGLTVPDASKPRPCVVLLDESGGYVWIRRTDDASDAYLVPRESLRPRIEPGVYRPVPYEVGGDMRRVRVTQVVKTTKYWAVVFEMATNPDALFIGKLDSFAENYERVPDGS